MITDAMVTVARVATSELAPKGETSYPTAISLYDQHLWCGALPLVVHLPGPVGVGMCEWTPLGLGGKSPRAVSPQGERAHGSREASTGR